jgi:exopolysaccharide production protein ExoZ
MITSIQLLRVIAAYLIVFCHMPENLIPPGLSFLKGAFGVDIFFVISGFIMTSLAFNREQGVVAAWAFFRRRLIRIFPIYLVINITIFACVYFKEGKVPNAEFFIYSLMLIPISGENGILLYPYITAAWTLSFEIFFYSVVACLILTKKFNFWTLCGILMCLTVFGRFIHSHNALFGLMVASINIEFLFGAAIFFIFRKYGAFFNGYIGFGVTVGAIVSLFFLGQGIAAGAPGPYEGMQVIFETISTPRFVIWGIPSAFLVLGMLGTDAWLKKSWLAPSICKLGEASYSLYLTHGFLIYVMSKLLVMQSTIWILAILAIVSFASLIIYRFIERPILKSFYRLAI